MIRIIACVVALLVTGCAPKYQMQSSYDAQSAAWINTNGTGVITGQAFLRQRGGGVVTAAGQQIVLLPDIAYTRELITAAVSRQYSAPDNIDPQARANSRQTTADAEGRFRFDRLPAGNYVLVTTVRWMVGSQRQGGAVMGEARLGEGETVNVIMTH